MRLGRALAALLVLALSGACASAPRPYVPLAAEHVARQRPIADGRPQIEVGRPNALVDGLNHYILSIFAKLLLLNGRFMDHRLPEANRELLERYLAVNQLRSVKVLHNQYDPVGQFWRLWHNREVALPYRATIGVVGWLGYTLLPDRLLGGLPFVGAGDHFDPMTNTINVYSSDLAVLLHEAGHAKDFSRQRFKGTWALFRIPPILGDVVALFEERYASVDAVRFLACIEDHDAEIAAYRSLIPAYSTYVGGTIQQYVPFTGIPIVAVGHSVGWMQSWARDRALNAERPEFTQAEELPAAPDAGACRPSLRFADEFDALPELPD